jgi:XTP/dITP diphosphohydrolase
MKKLLIATKNPGKLGELSQFLSDLPITIVSLKDVGIYESVEETGKTFEENALLKAKYYQKLSGLVTLADDGGFEIDALGGAPGVKSRRWIHGDIESTDEELIDYTLKQMKGIPQEKRGAQLRLVLALSGLHGELFTEEGAIRGIVPLKPSTERHEGFPFRSLLFLPDIAKFYSPDGLTEEESYQLNHRRKTVEKLKPKILGLLTKPS